MALQESSRRASYMTSRSASVAQHFDGYMLARAMCKRGDGRGPRAGRVPTFGDACMCTCELENPIVSGAAAGDAVGPGDERASERAGGARPRGARAEGAT